MLTEKEKLDTLTHLMIELNQVSDLDILMEHILNQARRFVNADAGSIYIVDGDDLQFTYTQNDTLQKRLKQGEKLIYSTFTLPINEQSIAGYVAATGRPLNLPDVYHIEPIMPYRFSKSFDEASHYTTRSALTIPLKSANGTILGILQIINAQDAENRVIPFSATDEKMMMHFASIAAVALERAQMTRAIILRMIKMAELRDPKETGAHVNRVGGFAVEIYERWAVRRNLAQKVIDKNRDILRMAAMLHDVGKVAISDLILKKPGRFNDDEFEIMKQHTILGAQLFLGRQSDFDDAASQVALTHHERWDGAGYPRALSGESIPESARIVALVDVYDALSNDRIYRKASPEEEVLQIMSDGRESHFNPNCYDLFIELLPEFNKISEENP